MRYTAKKLIRWERTIQFQNINMPLSGARRAHLSILFRQRVTEDDKAVMAPIQHKERIVIRPILSSVNNVTRMIQEEFSRKFKVCIQTEYEDPSWF